MASIADIEQISASIAREFNPQKILLFGSHVWGTPTPDSDVDMLVILPFEGNGHRVIDGKEVFLGPVSEAFKPIVTAMSNWEVEIMNYFDHPVTNAFTQCLNGLIRVIECSGRGYSFDALRSKILYTAGTHKKVTPPFQRKRSTSDFEGFAYFTGSTPERLKEKNLGTDISTLLKIIQADSP